jgi:hypothetical protein
VHAYPVSRWQGGIRWLAALGCVLAGFVIPFVIVILIVGWAEPDPQGSDMALGLYEVFLGAIAGLLGMVIAGVLSVRWYSRSLRHFGRWMTVGLACPVAFCLTLYLAQ